MQTYHYLLSQGQVIVVKLTSGRRLGGAETAHPRESAPSRPCLSHRYARDTMRVCAQTPLFVLYLGAFMLSFEFPSFHSPPSLRLQYILTLPRCTCPFSIPLHCFGARATWGDGMPERNQGSSRLVSRPCPTPGVKTASNGFRVFASSFVVPSLSFPFPSFHCFLIFLFSCSLFVPAFPPSFALSLCYAPSFVGVAAWWLEGAVWVVEFGERKERPKD